MFVRDLREADASCGGKALGLARLLSAGGLSVPDGFVITNELFERAAGPVQVDDTATIGHVLDEAAKRIADFRVPPEVMVDVEERAKALGSRVAVRSSATIEDAAAGAGAGIFSSKTGVLVGEIWDAIRAVWTSALTPLAAAYARDRGGKLAIGVIVQELVEGERVAVYTRPPGSPKGNEVLLQRGEHLIRVPRDNTQFHVSLRGSDPAVDHAVLVALKAERAIEANDGADVELVQNIVDHATDSVVQTWVVQARPIVHPAPIQLAPPPPAVLAPLHDGRTWTWDVAHNPDPLSVAQTELVERVEAAAIAPYSLKVCAGFLYYAPKRDAVKPTVTSARDLVTRAAELEAKLDATLSNATLSLDQAVERYLAFYKVWAGELGPLIAAAREVLPRALADAGHKHADLLAGTVVETRPSAVEVTLVAAARGELDEKEVTLQLGALSPAWDVAVATYGERAGLLQDAIARAATALRERATRAADPLYGRPSVPTIDPAIVTRFANEIAIAKCAADLAERDDGYFARAQLMVRRALIARGAQMGLTPDDVFWLRFEDLAQTRRAPRAENHSPLDDLVLEQHRRAPTMDSDDARRRAAAARSAAERAARWRMPLAVAPRQARETRVIETDVLRGVGTGPRVTGRVVRFASLASAIAVGSGDVVVTRAVTPALAVLVAGCAALVSETGGLLDHGAALARELSIPCVVGCRDAWTQLTDGMVVTVDGAAGTVERT